MVGFKGLGSHDIAKLCHLYPVLITLEVQKRLEVTLIENVSDQTVSLFHTYSSVSKSSIPKKIWE